MGYRAGFGAADLTNATAIGANAMVSQSNSLVLGGTGTNAVNVGIGTTAPTQKLEVAGQIFSNTGGFRFPDNTVQTTAATGAGSNATVAAANGVSTIMASGITTVKLGGAGSDLTAATNIYQAGNNFSLTGGNVGIGTNAPAQMLGVAGNIQSSGNIAVDYGNANVGTVDKSLRFNATSSSEAIGSNCFSANPQQSVRTRLLHGLRQPHEHHQRR